jgi:hypothetical protein
MNALGALLLLGLYFLGLFIFGLYWTKRESRSRRKQTVPRVYGVAGPVHRGDFNQEEEHLTTVGSR